MARKRDDADPDPTLGGALPDPADDSPRGRFNRGEIDAVELDRLLSAGGSRTKASEA
jgi:hypothetical protein